MLACVIVAGWPISDSTPPRLSARLNSFVRVRSRRAASAPPLRRTLIMPPKSRICRARQVVAGMVRQARVVDPLDLRLLGQPGGQLAGRWRSAAPCARPAS